MPILNEHIFDEVEALLREAAEAHTMPGFRNLSADDIEEKAPGDLVTIVDRAVEAMLSPRLQKLAPASEIIGEETSDTSPAGLQKLQTALGDQGLEVPLWTIDPIDGTANYARGDEKFGTMISLVYRGEAIASWIHAPIPDELAVAEKGGGTILNGSVMRLSEELAPDEPKGALYVSYFPDDLKQAVEPLFEFDQHQPFGAAAWEYVSVLKGDRDFLLYNRLLPWDHIPGNLILAEAGGLAVTWNGRRYSPDLFEGPLIVSSNKAVNDRVRSILGLDPL